MEEPVSSIVREFLTSHNTTSSRGDVILDQVTVTGSGRGVQAAPNVWTTIKSWFNVLAYTERDKSSRTLLHGFSGTIHKGEILLVIGKPGSGCTTFLKTLANMGNEYKNTAGSITYGGRPANELAQDPVKFTFCAEEDEHLPTLTVAETLRFAVLSIWDSKASGKTIAAAVNNLSKMVGLNHVLHTNVGNASLRGVSGGERRRVSLAEAMATCPDILCFDNPTSGLDSSTALEFTQVMREYTSQHGCATAMSIYQGSNAMMPLFDKALVINSGRQIFYGKASEAKGYFESLGFICPERTTTMDFLNSMSAEAGIRHVREDCQLQAPLNAEQFEQAFRQSKHYQTVIEKAPHERTQTQSVSQRFAVYSLPLHRQVYECAFRQFRVLITDWNTWAVEALCIILQSLVLGTLFRNQSRSSKSFFILASSLFYSALVPALQSMSEFGNTFAQRSLVIRQKQYRLYRPMAYALGLVATDAVWKIVAIAYNIPLYFMTGFQRTPGHFFTWFFTIYIEHMALSMIFRAIAVFSTSAGRAILPVGIMFNLFVLYTGLYVPGPQMQIWLFWLKYCNPLYYAFETLMVNEFSSQEYECSTVDLAPSGFGYNSIANQVCAVPGSVSGQSFLSGASFLHDQYGFEASHLWRNVGINAAIFAFFAVCTGVGMELHKPPAGRLATVFYKADPKEVISAKISQASDIEKGDMNGDTPPLTAGSQKSTAPAKPFLDHNGQTLAWSNISLDMTVGGENKKLLDDVNGFVEGGQLTALMGVSGAGKTTLLNTLAGRLNLGTITGDLLLGGKPLPKAFRRYMGYVQQQDIHLPTQTVREALQMTAQLRRPEDVSAEEQASYIDAVIEMLEMEDIADALIGVPGAGLNLEQRKRVTIGVELSAKPGILFLDEPTSGLDGQSALIIVRLLRKLANSGQTILCTIHQPAADIIETFDHLILLVRGGKLAYDGPLGPKCVTAIQYFSNLNRPCGKDENPAEYFLEVIGAGSRSTATADWAQLWNSSNAREHRQLQSRNLASPSLEMASPLHTESTYATTLYVQLSTVLRRTWLYYWREPDYFVSKLLMNVGNSLLNSMTFLQSASNEKGAYNRVFSAFMSLIVGPPLGLQVAPRFTTLRDIFLLREKDSLTYHWSVFVISAIVVELPYAIITSLVYWLLWYYPVGYFADSSRAGYSFLMYELFSVFATSLAQFCAALMPSLNATFAANGFFFMFCNTFAGTLSPKPVTPSGWRWFYNLSPLFYLGEGVTTDVLEGLQISCDPSETSTFQPPRGTTCSSYAAAFLKTATGYLLNPDDSSDCNYCRYKNGQSYYTQYGYDFANRYRNVGVFIGFIAFNYTFVIVLTYFTKIKKWRRN